MDKDTLRKLARADQRTAAAHDATHETLVDAIWEAADEKMRQVDIIAAVGLTRERVRVICSGKYRREALERRAKGEQR